MHGIRPPCRSHGLLWIERTRNQDSVRSKDAPFDHPSWVAAVQTNIQFAIALIITTFGNTETMSDREGTGDDEHTLPKATVYKLISGE